MNIWHRAVTISRRKHDAMTAGLKRLEEVICQQDCLIEPGLGRRDIDQEFLSRL